MAGKQSDFKDRSGKSLEQYMVATAKESKPAPPKGKKAPPFTSKSKGSGK